MSEANNDRAESRDSATRERSACASESDERRRRQEAESDGRSSVEC